MSVWHYKLEIIEQRAMILQNSDCECEHNSKLVRGKVIKETCMTVSLGSCHRSCPNTLEMNLDGF